MYSMREPFVSSQMVFLGMFPVPCRTKRPHTALNVRHGLGQASPGPDGLYPAGQPGRVIGFDEDPAYGRLALCRPQLLARHLAPEA